MRVRGSLLGGNGTPGTLLIFPAWPRSKSWATHPTMGLHKTRRPAAHIRTHFPLLMAQEVGPLLDPLPRKKFVCSKPGGLPTAGILPQSCLVPLKTMVNLKSSFDCSNPPSNLCIKCFSNRRWLACLLSQYHFHPFAFEISKNWHHICMYSV